MPIECLLFDLGKVLIDFDFDRGMALFAGRSTLGPERFRQVLLNEHWKCRYERGEISTAEYHQYLTGEGGLQMGLDEFRDAWSAVFLPEPILSEGLLVRLKRRYPLILLSNTNEAHIDFIAERYSVLSYFDERILSHEVGAMKPDPRIFEAAIAASGKPADRLFFTDDLPQNIEGARRSGIHARQFISEPDLIADLRGYGVEV